jgi:serine protease AprX
MSRKILFMFLVGLIWGNSFSQTGHWLVYFTSKDTGVNLYNFFDAKAIERREKQHIKFDVSDYPVKQDYINRVAGCADSVFYSYRWLNALWIYADSDNIEKIKKLPFVRKVEKLDDNGEIVLCGKDLAAKENRVIKRLKDQINSLGGDLFIKSGYRGKGVRIAVLDAGFTRANKSVFLKHLFDNGQILKAYDFIRKDTIKYKHSSHGRMTLSCIAGQRGDTIIGLATDAEFLLARTEYNNIEPFKEELLWMKAAEWADRYGADIISSSLGYEKPRYCRKDMDGKTSYVSQAALWAARKGILVVNAAGNSGDSKWRMLGAPADADSIIAVGGAMCCYKLAINFTGVGPTYDGRMKPELSANADVEADGIRDLSHVYGTSFSTPLVSGFAACVLQMHPDWNNMKLREELMKSGHLYPYFDYSLGYGLPQASYFINGKKKFDSTGKVTSVVGSDNYVGVKVVDAKFGNDVLYYRIEDKNGNILKYGATVVKSKIPVYFDRDYMIGKTLRVFYNGEIKVFHF